MELCLSSKIKNYLISLAAVLCMFATYSTSYAASLSFSCITSNDTSGDNCTIGETQLSVDVTDAGSNQVLFTFLNTASGAPSSIEGVYFDDGSLLGIASIDNSSPGVSFSQGAAPPNLPGGNGISPAFLTTAGLLADSDPPPAGNGVNTGEFVGIRFDLQSGKTFGDVIAELANGDLRVGMHVIAIGSGGSESFVNNPVPLPAAVWLFGSGLLGLAGVARRKRA